MAKVKVDTQFNPKTFGERMAEFRRKMEDSNRAVSISFKPTKDRTAEEIEFFSDWKFRVMLRRERIAALNFLEGEIIRVRKELGLD